MAHISSKPHPAGITWASSYNVTMSKLSPLCVPGVRSNELMGVSHGVVDGLLEGAGVDGLELVVRGPLVVRDPGLVGDQPVLPLPLVLQQGENQKYASRDQNYLNHF